MTDDPSTPDGETPAETPTENTAGTGRTRRRQAGDWVRGAPSWLRWPAASLAALVLLVAVGAAGFAAGHHDSHGGGSDERRGHSERHGHRDEADRRSNAEPSPSASAS